MTIAFPAAIYDAVREHARAGAPEEVVGVLGGSHGTSHSTVARAYRARNVAEEPRTRYEIDPSQELELLERIDDAGLDCVGFYHSHPNGPPGTSETDARLAAWPDYSYVIVSIESGRAELGSWRWRGDHFEREGVRTE